jgi:integral membrane protein (TIGR01906 family)
VETLRGRAASLLIGVATALVVVAVTLPLFLNPLWVAFEQGRAEATAWTGFSEPELRAATDAVLSDLVFGPPDFDVAVRNVPVLTERERGHMRDVRGVFAGFLALSLAAAACALFLAARRRGPDRSRTWRAVRGGALGLIVALLVGGAISFVAFDALFETFHTIFFPGGSYTFDPATERLVQLFPFRFWQETSIAVGVVCIVVAGLVAAIATRRGATTAVRDRGEASTDGAPADGASSLSAAGPPR